MNRRGTFWLIVVLSLCTLLITPCVGLQWISPWNISHNEQLRFILYSIRIPRTLTGFLAGGGLAVCGMVYQAIFRNALAEPSTLGVSFGASLGAALCIMLGAGTSLFGLSATSLGAFAGAIGAMLFVYAFAWTKESNSTTVLLAGVIVGTMCSGLIMAIHFVSPLQQSFQVLRWLMGGIDGSGYQQLVFLAVFLCGYLALIAARAQHLDLLLTGDSIAHSRGLDVRKSRNVLIVATALAVGAIVTVCGPIGFVGIIAPHVCRLALPGMRHRLFTVCAFLLGGTFLSLSDALARSVVPPSEIPVGIITSLLGGPFFLAVLLRRKKNLMF